MNSLTSPTSYSAQIIHGEYYPHIDGIRALAVLPVVLFHVLAALCPGGFAGVDVFFVISGYLITGGILRDLKKDRFTIRNFYHRRIRRIMPAYFAMIAGVFAVGCTLYYAQPLIFLGDAVTAGTLFVANLHFWMLGGDYFAPELHSQALLHLWSLSVEEQFYLFIPLLCAIIWKFRRSLVVPVLALLAALSLVGAVYAVLHGKHNNAFYFLHFRAWELLTGSLLATLPAFVHSPNSCDSRLQDLKAQISPAFLAALGLLMVLIPYVVISSKTPPGLAALPPVIGTALLIRYGQSGWVSRLLSCRPLVMTGKISYSLYLWHWPVTVFWKYAVYDQLYYYDYIGMFLLSLLLGYLSWKIVEIPVRTSPSWTLRRSFAFAISGIMVLVTLGTVCVCCKGWPTILHPKANKVAYMPMPRDPFVVARAFAVIRRLNATTLNNLKIIIEHDRRLKIQSTVYYSRGENDSSHIGASGQPKVFIIGDSHAGSLRYGLDNLLLKNNLAGYAISCSSTDMFNLRLPKTLAALRKLEELSLVSHVVLAEAWTRSLAIQEQEQNGIYSQLEEFSTRIRSMNKRLFIVTEIPCYANDPSDIEARKQIISPRQGIIVRDSRQQTKKKYDCMQGKINRKLEEVCNRTGAILIPLHLAFKQGDGYTSVEVQEGQSVFLYRNGGHLSLAGSLRAAQFIMPYLSPDAVLQK